MDNLVIVALITGLTTGGLSCLAVQGGLVTSSIAQKIEEELREKPRKKTATTRTGLPVAQPIALFLLAKLAVHTLFGFMLGWLGSALTLTPIMRGILQLAIGIFMVGNALRMLKVHPIFRYFNFEPPASVTRYIRRTSRNKTAGSVTPVLLGALTVLIPCGITQTMMAAAIGTGSPALGALVMASFVLGTSPVFFAVTYLATRLGALFEKRLVRIAAVVLVILGIVSFDTGLNLVGSPFSLTRAAASLRPVVSQPDPAGVASGEVVKINVLNNGYKPQKVFAKAGEPLHLLLVTDGVYSCSRAFVIPQLALEKLLPATGEVTVDVPAQPQGSSLAFACSMGMYTGTIYFQ
jgi:sulfite exporter TauE/SafE